VRALGLTDGTNRNMSNSAQLGSERAEERAKPGGGGEPRFIGVGRARRAPKDEKEIGSNAMRTYSHLVQSFTDTAPTPCLLAIRDVL